MNESISKNKSQTDLINELNAQIKAAKIKKRRINRESATWYKVLKSGKEALLEARKIINNKRMLLYLIISLALISVLTSSCHDNPNDLGTHWNYSVECHDGFKYKILGDKRGVIPILHSDGSPVKCMEEQY
jgi:hypothetical protein